MPLASAIDLEELIARVATGDQQAFAELYDRTCSIVFGLIVRIVGDRALAEDIAQDAYLQVWKSAPRFERDRGSGLAWIATIARSRSIDRTRSDASYRGAVESLGSAGPGQPLGDASADPEEDASLAERRRLVARALVTLPAEQREAIELAFFKGLSQTEIAEVTGSPLGTVKSRVRAAVGKLEEELRAFFRYE